MDRFTRYQGNEIKRPGARLLWGNCFSFTSCGLPGSTGHPSPWRSGLDLSTTSHVGLDEEQLGNGTGLSRQEGTRTIVFKQLRAAVGSVMGTRPVVKPYSSGFCPHTWRACLIPEGSKVLLKIVRPRLGMEAKRAVGQSMPRWSQGDLRACLSPDWGCWLSP